MNNLPHKFLVDTNVPKTANLAVDPGSIADDLIECVLACVETLQEVMKNGGLVLDDGDEIFDEYLRQLSMRGQPGVGDAFMKWVHDNRYQFPPEDRVSITRRGYSYVQFPNHPDLNSVDPSDRKFIAVSNGHPGKPPILEGTDSKWWGWTAALQQCGILVIFVCDDYVRRKYAQKMGKQA